MTESVCVSVCLLTKVVGGEQEAPRTDPGYLLWEGRHEGRAEKEDRDRKTAHEQY